MRGFRRPVGDQPPSVYWRRRVTLALAVVMASAIGWLVATAVASGADDGAAAPATAAESFASPTASAGAGASAAADSATAARTPEPETSATPGAAAQGSAIVPSCEAADVVLRMGAEPTITADAVTFEVVASHSSAGACLLDGAGPGTELVITSGEARIWSSADCDAEPLGAQWLLDGEVDQRFDVTWPRAWSEPGCGDVGASAPAGGYYWAHLAVQEIAAEPVQFVLPSS